MRCARCRSSLRTGSEIDWSSAGAVRQAAAAIVNKLVRVRSCRCFSALTVPFAFVKQCARWCPGPRWQQEPREEQEADETVDRVYDWNSPLAATRRALAATVNAGLTAADDGNTLASTTQRLSTSCARPFAFRTLRPGSVPIAIVPH